MSTHETCLAFIFWLSHCHGVSPSATIAAATLPNSRLQSSRARLHHSVQNESHFNSSIDMYSILPANSGARCQNR